MIRRDCTTHIFPVADVPGQDDVRHVKLPLFPLAGITAILLFQSAFCATTSALPCKLTKLEDRIRIEIGNKLFSEYVFKGAPRPFFYPILAADGTQLNRDFPMKNTDGEEHDHPHHRSLWFTHGSVNGVDFWSENKNHGSICTEGEIETADGDEGVLKTKHRWLDSKENLVCTDETIVRIGGDKNTRWLDYKVTLHALPNQNLVLGDTKEGSMAIRLAQWMAMPHKYNKRPVATLGQAINSQGARNAEAWGKRAAWVDYYAPREGKIYGVAILDHPQNPNHPTWWHVRDYGLFAANPFGKHDFESLKNQPHVGDVTIPAGGKITFRWRIIFHEGDTTSAAISTQYASFSKTP